MHVSLDQALGRQPRLNRVGQSLLNIGSGASAAYSLRSLTGGDPKVVNVRRDADDEEREFTASGVNSELENWVNGKLETTLPADVASAAAAYSLRKVRSAYTGNAVQIRRTSDNVEVDVAFDANGEVSTSSAITNVTEETSGSSEGSTTATTLGDFISGTDAAVVTWYDQSGNGEDATQLTSGDQPLLAESGSLLTSTNGKVAIDLRRTSSSDGPFLLASSVSGLVGSLSMFTLVDFDETGSPLSLSNSTAGNRYFAINEGSTTHQVISRNTTTVTVSDTVTGNERIGFGVTTGQTSTKSSVDGGSLVEDTTDYGDDFGAGDLDQILIGALRTVSPTSHFDGHIQELLVYTSDQSSNRFKIESNINNHYDNANYDDTRDGFVETWFDQSGNDNDATDATSGTLDDQPQIVSSGSLIVDSNSNPTLEFDGDVLTFTDIVMDADAFSVFAFADSDSENSFNEIVGKDGTNHRIAIYRSLNGERAAVNLAGSGNWFPNPGNFQDNDKVSIHTFLKDATNTNWYVDGTNRGTDSSGDTTDTTFDEIGKGRTGVISEVIIYKDIDKSSDRTLIEGNMNNYYESF